MSGIIDAILHGKSDSAEGMGGVIFIDGLIVVIVAVIDMINKNAFANMDPMVCGIIMIAFGLLTAGSGALMVKAENKKTGYILGMAVNALMLVLGIVLTFNIVNNTLIFEIYYLIAGLINLFMLLLPTTRAGVF